MFCYCVYNYLKAKQMGDVLLVGVHSDGKLHTLSFNVSFPLFVIVYGCRCIIAGDTESFIYVNML